MTPTVYICNDVKCTPVLQPYIPRHYHKNSFIGLQVFFKT